MSVFSIRIKVNVEALLKNGDNLINLLEIRIVGLNGRCYELIG